MSINVEAGGLGLGDAGADGEVTRARGEGVTGVGVGEGGGHEVVCCFGDEAGEVIVGDDYAGFIVGVEGEVHVGEVFDELLDHADDGLLEPVLAVFDVLCCAVADEEAHEEVVGVADGFLGAGADGCGFERPEGAESVVDGVVFVDHLDAFPLGELVPFVEVWWRRDLVSSPILSDRLLQALRLALYDLHPLDFCIAYKLVDRMYTRVCELKRCE